METGSVLFAAHRITIIIPKNYFISKPFAYQIIHVNLCHKQKHKNILFI